MKHAIKSFIRRLPLFPLLQGLRERREQRREYARWEASGRKGQIPHIVKQQTLRFYAQKHGLKVLVETGTYLGSMVEAMRPHFERVYSIELSKELHAKAVARFARAANVELIQGDSGVELGRLAPRIKQPALFWLDGHYSAGNTAKGDKLTPIFEELSHLLGAPDLGHVFVIDDARLFGQDPAYPTLAELKAFVLSRRPKLEFAVQGDSIRITPAQGPAAATGVQA